MNKGMQKIFLRTNLLQCETKFYFIYNAFKSITLLELAFEIFSLYIYIYIYTYILRI